MSEWIADRICTGNLSILKNHFPPDLLRTAAKLVRNESEAISQMEFGLKDTSISSTCASILSFTGTQFQPPPNSVFNLRHAQLEKVHWIDATVKSLDASHSKFDHGLFERCRIENWNALECSLHSVSFRNCDLPRFKLENSSIAQSEFERCDLSGCDMTNTELNDVRMTDCEMSHGWFPSCKMTDVTIQRSNLTCSWAFIPCSTESPFAIARSMAQTGRESTSGTVSWRAYRLRSELGAFEFRGTRPVWLPFCQRQDGGLFDDGDSPTKCQLGRSSIAFCKTWLRRLGGCNLRNADLSGCLFHLGGSRDGLVGSPYPSHGTRTGFYRDDLEELVFKDAEEVCRARIVHCDLTGANIQNIDFYLVDLRGSIVSADQRDQILSTGGIIDR